MYKDFYQMKIEAFGSLPLLKIFFNSSTHNSTWHYLLYGIASSEPFLMVTGDYGMGKTTLCLGLIRFLEQKGETDFVYISTPNYGYAGILSEIATKLGIAEPHGPESQLQNQIYQHFRKQETPKSFMLIIDDAHDLDLATLEKMRALSNFNHNGVFPFRFIFFAHTSFQEKLQEPSLIPLNQRIKRRSHLEHFEYAEVKEYIFSRLVKSGAPGIPTFSEDALGLIFTNSRGIPRLINNICDACLLIAATRRKVDITAAIVREAIANVLESSGKQTEDERFVISGDEPAAGRETAAEAPEADYYEDEYEDDYGYDEPYDRGPYDQRSGGRPMLNLGGPIASGPGPAVVDVTPKKRSKIGLIILILVILCILVGLTYYAIDLYWKRSFDEAMETKDKSPYESEQTYTSPKKNAAVNPPATNPSDTGQKDGSNKSLPSDWSQKSLNKYLDRSSTWDKETDSYKPAGQNSIQTASNTKAPLGPGAELETGRMLPPQQRMMPEAGMWPYSLHLSSYRHFEQAMEEVNQYARRGLNPYMVQVNLGDKGKWWRIFLGHYRTMEAARQAQSRLGVAGVSVQNTPFANFIGAYNSDAEVTAAVERLKSQGYFPYTIKGEGNVQKLYVGAFSDRQSAETHNQRLLSDGSKSRVVRR